MSKIARTARAAAAASDAAEEKLRPVARGGRQPPPPTSVPAKKRATAAARRKPSAVVSTAAALSLLDSSGTDSDTLELWKGIDHARRRKLVKATKKRVDKKIKRMRRRDCFEQLAKAL